MEERETEREKDREGQRDGEGRKGWRKLFPATANVKGGEFLHLPQPNG